MEAARRAYRLAKDRLHEARDPASSKEAYEAVWAATDEVGRARRQVPVAAPGAA
jgi:hypothetical protein